MTSTKSSEREFEYDVMRAIAAIAVVCIHVCAMSWRNVDVNSSEWLVITVYDMLCKFSVPLFFMISGRFYLDEKRSFNIKSVFTKKIPGLLLAFIFWSFVYMAENIIRTSSFKDNWKWIVLEFFAGEYHMWFILAIIGLYLITPFLRLIASNDDLCKYFILLFCVFQFFLPALENAPHIGTMITQFLESTHMNFVLGYSGHYILGWYLKKHDLSICKRVICYVLGIVGALFSIISTIVMSFSSGVPNESLSDCLTWNVAVVAFATYIAIKQIKEKYGVRFNNTISIVSKYSFGIYLSHPLILWIFSLVGFMPNFINPIIGVPIVTACALSISLLLSMILRKIPKIGKFIT